MFVGTDSYAKEYCIDPDMNSTCPDANNRLSNGLAPPRPSVEASL